MNEKSIVKCNFERGKRILVTSDIHGQLTYLDRVLKKAEFCDGDILVIVGDIIEKGFQSLKTLRYVMELCKRDNVFVLQGNVDIWRVYMINGICSDSAEGFFSYLESMRGWNRPSIFDDMTAELGYICRTPEDVVRARNEVMEHFKTEIDFIVNLPVVLETQNYIFVHGGLRDKTVDENMNRDSFSLLKYDNFMSTELEFDKYVVVGHWPVCLYGDSLISFDPVIDREKKIISIDGGCGIKDWGQLNLLVIPDIECDVSEIHHIYCDELPVLIASEAQEGREPTVKIRWTDNEIKILDRDADFSYIHHMSSEKELWVPNTFIYSETQCRDYTDNVLSVSVGDKLSLIEKNSRGYIVKKDGVVGWYFGSGEML